MRLETIANGERNAIRFGVRWGDNERRLHLAAAFHFAHGGEVGIRQQLVTNIIARLLDPAELVEFLESVSHAAFAEGLGCLLVITLLAEDFRDLGHPEAGIVFQELQGLTGRDAAMLAAIADEYNAGIEAVGHVENGHHIPRAKLARLVDEDNSFFGRFLHRLVFEEPGHRVSLGKPGFLP